MATGFNRGKQWEKKFKEDFLKLPNSTIDRLFDSTNGFKSISTVSDFIGFIGNKDTESGNIYYLECKSIKGNTFPLANLTQFDKLILKSGIPGVRAGVILWFIEHDCVWYVPISTIAKMKRDDKKSINVKKDIEAGYRIFNIPGTKKRVFIDCDYSILKTLKDGD